METYEEIKIVYENGDEKNLIGCTSMHFESENEFNDYDFLSYERPYLINHKYILRYTDIYGGRVEYTMPPNAKLNRSRFEADIWWVETLVKDKWIEATNPVKNLLKAQQSLIGELRKGSTARINGASLTKQRYTE